MPVLLIEGDARTIGSKERDSYFVANAHLAGAGADGHQAADRAAAISCANKPLDGFHAIYVLNVERLTEAEVAALEDYTNAGGGVVFFLGDRTQRRAIQRDGSIATARACFPFH